MPEAEFLPAVASRTRLPYIQDLLVDMVLADPSRTQAELAVLVGKGQQWVSTVMRSDEFRERLRERGGEVIDPILTATVQQRMADVASKALEHLSNKMDMPSNEVPDQLVIRALEVASRSMEAHIPRTQININHLEVLGENLVKLLHRKRSE